MKASPDHAETPNKRKRKHWLRGLLLVATAIGAGFGYRSRKLAQNGGR